MSYHPDNAKLTENAGALATVEGSSFQNRTIEADVAGAPAPYSDPSARGFIGITSRY